MGLRKNGDTPQIDIDQSPWSLELKGTMKPTNNKELDLEVCHWQKLFTVSEAATGNKQFSIEPNKKSRLVLVERLNT